MYELLTNSGDAVIRPPKNFRLSIFRAKTDILTCLPKHGKNVMRKKQMKILIIIITNVYGINIHLMAPSPTVIKSLDQPAFINRQVN